MANELTIVPAGPLSDTLSFINALSGGVTEATKLPAMPVLVELRGALESHLVPIGRGDRAEFWTKAIISAYPRVPDMFSPEGYILAVSSVLADLPDDIARQVVDQVTRKLKFMPTRAEVAEVADALLNERKVALYRAKRMMEEHERRKAEAARDEQIARDRTEFFANGGKEKLAEMMAPFKAAFRSNRKEKTNEPSPTANPIQDAPADDAARPENQRQHGDRPDAEDPGPGKVL